MAEITNRSQSHRPWLREQDAEFRSTASEMNNLRGPRISRASHTFQLRVALLACVIVSRLGTAIVKEVLCSPQRPGYVFRAR